MKDLWVKPVPGTQEAFKKHLLAYGHQEGKAGGGGSGGAAEGDELGDWD